MIVKLLKLQIYKYFTKNTNFGRKLRNISNRATSNKPSRNENTLNDCKQFRQD